MTEHLFSFYYQNDSKVKTDSLPSKMEGNESIILQMNKERLRLERQLSLLMKASFLQMAYMVELFSFSIDVFGIPFVGFQKSCYQAVFVPTLSHIFYLHKVRFKIFPSNILKNILTGNSINN